MFHNVPAQGPHQQDAFGGILCRIKGLNYTLPKNPTNFPKKNWKSSKLAVSLVI